jgi:hypothetical protein
LGWDQLKRIHKLHMIMIGRGARFHMMIIIGTC